MFGLKRLQANLPSVCGWSLSSPPELFPILQPLVISDLLSPSLTRIVVCVTGLRGSLGQEDVQKEPPAPPEGLVWRHSSGGKPIDPRF